MPSEFRGGGSSGLQRDFGSPTRDFHPATRDFGSQTRDFGSQTRDFGSQTRDSHPATRDFGSQTRKFHPATRDFLRPRGGALSGDPAEEVVAGLKSRCKLKLAPRKRNESSERIKWTLR